MTRCCSDKTALPHGKLDHLPPKNIPVKDFGWISPLRGSHFKTFLSPHHMWCHLALSSVVKYRPEHRIQAWRDPWSMSSKASSTACRRRMRWWGAGDYPPSTAMRIIILQQDSRTEDVVGDWVWWKVVDLWTHFRPKQRGGDVVADDNLGSSGPWA